MAKRFLKWLPRLHYEARVAYVQPTMDLAGPFVGTSWAHPNHRRQADISRRFNRWQKRLNAANGHLGSIDVYFYLVAFRAFRQIRAAGGRTEEGRLAARRLLTWLRYTLDIIEKRDPRLAKMLSPGGMGHRSYLAHLLDTSVQPDYAAYW